MGIITKDLLINFLFILLPLFLLQMIYLLKIVYRIDKLKDILVTILSTVSIILCMLFPFSVGDELFWDLRRIPFIIGILYGRKNTAFILLLSMLLIRYLLWGANTGFYISIITFTLLAIIVNYVSRYYLKMGLVKKVWMSVLLVILSTQVTYFTTSLLFTINLSANMWVQFFVITVVGMLLATLLIEVIRMNSDMLEKLIKAEKLEVVSHLAASISHEVRNPLTTCKGFLQLSYEQEKSPEVKKYLGTAIHELDRASDIINDYLTFAKPAPEKVEKVFVFQEVHNVVNVLTPLANMQDVQIFTNLNESNENYISGDRKKLEQSLINIVKNGIESMPNGGKLIINSVVDYPVVRIKIRDEGKGMTQQQINRLGEPYFTMKNNGTGLGMMVSFSLIKGMGGHISVDSEVGKWTSFTIEFPMAF
ncbi:MAG: ATP-binding protein [Paenisporosarcina sp.]|nr:ATP-binding protein [Paenisporosarcina sp.]